ncbi:class I SAM-dependent methyltransferase [Amycolatopsis rifamycinica]|uniref:Methyltransferase type 11 n=1 Tax=Amycolatopsis rifamycinica TaxID=287986 RepID=A0A066TQN7_9PSEU|nr:class I SAM-dependent methyltransferase [Amycolatopsis rifamycinica]KDN17155.1 methyltransferase type 11 [Amycolatopsis rifamycinica]
MAESFGTDAERYDRARPAYPQELVDQIVTASPGADVLDIGCGTGIEARQFRAAGCRVLGVDPDARMAAFARRGGIDVEVATFEDWEPAGRTFDAVVAGQAWHWVDPVTGPAKAAQVLRPGGLLAVFAHVFQPPAAVADAFAAACRRVLPGSPFAGESRPAAEIYDVMFTGFADAIAQTEGLDAPERCRFAWERTYTRDEWLDFLPTTGGLTRLPPEALAEVLSEVAAAIEELGGSFVLPYSTLAVFARRA